MAIPLEMGLKIRTDLEREVKRWIELLAFHSFVRPRPSISLLVKEICNIAYENVEDEDQT